MLAGLTPWAAVTDRAAGPRPGRRAPAGGAREAGRLAERLDQVPVLLALFADLRALAAVDRDHARYTFAGGASIYRHGTCCWRPGRRAWAASSPPCPSAGRRR